MRRAIAVLALAVITNAVQAEQLDTTKLRQALRLPQLTTNIGVSYNQATGFSMNGWDPPDLDDAIAAAQASLHGKGEDGERYVHLGRLYALAEDPKHGEQAFHQAVEAYRREVKPHSHNGRLLAGYGEALQAAGMEDEAETVLRQAVKDSPKEWSAWTALGETLANKALETAFRASEKNPAAGPSPEDIQAAGKLMAEAAGAYDKAISVAPREPLPYVMRGMFRLGIASIAARAPAGTEQQQTAAGASAQALSDIEQAASLSPADFRAEAMVAFYHSLPYMHGFSSEETWKALPDGTRVLVRRLMDRLQATAVDKQLNKATAASALAVLGLVQITIQSDRVQGEKSLRQALALDPSRTDAEALMVNLLVAEQRYPDLAAFAQERIKHKDAVRLRLVAAKAYEKLNQSEREEEQLRAAVRLRPDDFNANLGLAVALLKRAGSAGNIAEAGKLLNKASGILASSPSRDQETDLHVTSAVYSALTGHVPEARQQLKTTLEQDSNSEQARYLLAALGG